MDSQVNIKSGKPTPTQVVEMFRESKRRKKEHFEWMRRNINKITLVN